MRQLPKSVVRIWVMSVTVLVASAGVLKLACNDLILQAIWEASQDAEGDKATFKESAVVVAVTYGFIACGSVAAAAISALVHAYAVGRLNLSGIVSSMDETEERKLVEAIEVIVVDFSGLAALIHTQHQRNVTGWKNAVLETIIHCRRYQSTVHRDLLKLKKNVGKQTRGNCEELETLVATAVTDASLKLEQNPPDGVEKLQFYKEQFGEAANRLRQLVGEVQQKKDQLSERRT